MKQLSGLDASFLYMETPEMPMHVGSLMLFELPKGYQGDYYEDVKAMIAKQSEIKSSRETATDENKDRFFGRGKYARA